MELNITVLASYDNDRILLRHSENISSVYLTQPELRLFNQLEKLNNQIVSLIQSAESTINQELQKSLD